jgi:hypothetical protein
VWGWKNVSADLGAGENLELPSNPAERLPDLLTGSTAGLPGDLWQSVEINGRSDRIRTY